MDIDPHSPRTPRARPKRPRSPSPTPTPTSTFAHDGWRASKRAMLSLGGGSGIDRDGGGSGGAGPRAGSEEGWVAQTRELRIDARARGPAAPPREDEEDGEDARMSLDAEDGDPPVLAPSPLRLPYSPPWPLRPPAARPHVPHVPHIRISTAPAPASPADSLPLRAPLASASASASASPSPAPAPAPPHPYPSPHPHASFLSAPIHNAPTPPLLAAAHPFALGLGHSPSPSPSLSPSPSKSPSPSPSAHGQPPPPAIHIQPASPLDPGHPHQQPPYQHQHQQPPYQHQSHHHQQSQQLWGSADAPVASAAAAMQRKARFTMGPRADCEKCRLGMRGHWMHFD